MNQRVYGRSGFAPRWKIALVGLLALAFVATAAPAGNAAPDSLGTDFWLTFPGNLSSPTLSLFITGPTATSGTVDIPGLSFSQAFSVTPGTVTTVVLPSGAQINTSDTVENLGIHVTAGAEVTVYGLNRVPFTTDAYLGLPTDILDTEYIVQGYKNVDIVEGTEFAIVAPQDGTTVTITPTVTTGSRTAGVPYDVVLNQGQTYQLRNTNAAPADLSGTIILSTKPIAVFGGHECANIPAGAVACDHIVEEMTPTRTWGRDFVTVPLATRTGGDTFRFLAQQDGTDVSINGTVVATLNRGGIHEQILTQASVVTATKPILVTQYSNSSSFDGVTSDPFEVIIPPNEQFLQDYTVTTPASGFDPNFINVAIPTAAVASLTIDGAPVNPAAFTVIGTSAFSGAQLPVALGSHTLSASQPFGIIVYGFASFDSYGYPGGLSLSPIAAVTTLTLQPAAATVVVNTQHCVTATVSDAHGAGLAGIRVDFTAGGANSAIDFVTTGGDGTAVFCYVGANLGTDTIVASVGKLTAAATAEWVTALPVTALPAEPNFTG